MNEGGKSIAIIPARGGSRRIPGKNIKYFHGKPLIAYSIETAIESGLFEEIYVSTDSVEIAGIAKEYRARTIYRPDELALDEVGTQAVMRHVLLGLNTNVHGRLGKVIPYACCIYPTAPMLTAIDLREARAILAHEDNTDTAYVFSVGDNPLRDAGQFYFGRIFAFMNKTPLISRYSRLLTIPECRVCDINTPEDWSRAEKMYAELHGL